MKKDKNLSNQRSKKDSASFRSEASGFDCLEANPLTQKYDIAFYRHIARKWCSHKTR